jgi:hypothetical protein
MAVETVFLTYRHENDVHRERTRKFAERLQAMGVNIVFDQFFLDANPAGPDEGWPEWSSSGASNAEKVLIIVSPGWFRSYNGTEVIGKGLGAAAEARIIKQRLYDEQGLNQFVRLVVFDPADLKNIPLSLKGYQRFDPARDFTGIARWLTETVDSTPASVYAAEWPIADPAFEWQPADCELVREAFKKLLTAIAPYRVLLIRGASETGKSHLVDHLFGLALDLNWLACGRFDLKSGADLDSEFVQFVRYLNVNDSVNATAGQSLRDRLNVTFAALMKRSQPTLLLFDTFEQGGDWAHWVQKIALSATPRAPWLRLLVAGQKVPNPAGAPWGRCTAPVLELNPLGWETWYEYGKRHRPELTVHQARVLHRFSRGRHTLLRELLGPPA